MLHSISQTVVTVHSVWLLNAGKITKKGKHRNATGWLELLNRGCQVIKVTNRAIVWVKNQDLEKWLLNTRPLYTGSTVQVDN